MRRFSPRGGAADAARNPLIVRSSIRAAGALAIAIALVGVGGARAEIAARGVQDGMLALSANGTPSVAYVRGTSMQITTRVSKERWRVARAATVPAGSSVMAFRVGAKGPVALVHSSDDRTLFVVRRRAARWQRIRLAGVPARDRLGWPGLVLTGEGLPVVAYTRWTSGSQNSRLLLARINAQGRARTTRITTEGFPQSAVPPPAAPVIVRGRVHVIESYGYRGVLGTIEWYPERNTWTGLFIDAGVGDFPVGPVLARSTAAGTVYAAWTVSILGFGAIPVTLAVHGRETSAEFVLDRALMSGLAVPSSGPEVAANEWVGADELGLSGDAQVWAGTVVRGPTRVELDGVIAGYSAGARGGRDLLLAQPTGLSWFRSPRTLTTSVTVDADAQAGGSVRVTGSVRGVRTGRVTIYRERPGRARQQAGQVALSGGSFSLVDRSPAKPLLYRAVYTDPLTGIPYAALLRDPVQ